MASIPKELHGNSQLSMTPAHTDTYAGKTALNIK